MDLSLRIGLSSSAAEGGASFTPAANVLFAAMTTPPTQARKILINNLIVSLQNAGVWTLLDALYLLAAADSQAATLNWVAPATFTLTPTGSPTFTTDRGFTGNGSTAYLDTAYTPSTAGKGMTLNDGHIAGWSLSNLAAATTNRLVGNAIATTGRTLLVPRNVGDICSPLVNDTGGLSVASTSTLGHFIANRSSATALQVYNNGTQLGAIVSASVSLATVPVCFLRDTTNFASLQVASGSIGRSLTAPQAAAFYNAQLTYLQAVGAA